MRSHKRARRPHRERAARSGLLHFPVNSSNTITRSTIRLNFRHGKSGLYRLKPENIDDFITSIVQPISHFPDNCGTNVDRLANFLRCRRLPCAVKKIGSLGKRTDVRGKTNADIGVMYINYTSVETFYDDMDDILDEIETTIRANQSLCFIHKTQHDVKADLRTEEGGLISVSILPGVYVTRDSNLLKQVYKKMGEKKRFNLNYSKYLVPLQNELFAGIPTQLKSLIRLLKYWKREILVNEVKRPTKWPSSYIMELIVLNAWEQAGEPIAFDMTRGLHAVLTSIVDHESFRVVFSTERRFYDEQFLPKRLPEHYIIDPCNPYNNVYIHPLWCWETFAVKAQEWLQKPLFKTVTTTHNQ